MFNEELGTVEFLPNVWWKITHKNDTRGHYLCLLITCKIKTFYSTKFFLKVIIIKTKKQMKNKKLCKFSMKSIFRSETKRLAIL